MSFTLAAPYPGAKTTSILPSPRFSDSEALAASVKAERAQDGTLYTYVKKRDNRHKLIWTFMLSRPKALELRAFLKVYFASRIKIDDHNDQAWQGYLMNNPFEFSTPRRGLKPISPSDVAAESVTITLEFEGVQI